MRQPTVGTRPRAGTAVHEEGRPDRDRPGSHVAKALVAELGVPTPASAELRPGVELAVPCPVVLKPSDDGSSVDLRICRTPQELMRARLELEPRRGRILAEEYIRGREMTVGIVNGEVLPIIEIVPNAGAVEFYVKEP